MPNHRLIEVGHPGFSRWHLRQRARAPICRRRQRPEFARRDLPDHGGSRREEHRNAARDEVRYGLRAALIRHVQQFDSGTLRK
jgi:hypothetical protein